MRVLLTGSAGFVGTAVGEVLEADGHEVVRVDLMLPQAHGDTRPPAGTHHVDVRDAASWHGLLRGVDAVCHQAALVGAGVAVADLPARQKEAVVLLRLKEMSGKEASAASGRAEGALKVSLHRAVESLRRMLSGD